MNYTVEDVKASAYHLIGALEDLVTMTKHLPDEVEGADPLNDAITALRAVARIWEMGE